MVVIVNSKGVWKDGLSAIYEAYLSKSPSISPHSVPPSYVAECSVCQTYRAGVESWGGGSVRSDSHACYNDTVHDHRSQARPLKTQHNSSTDKRVQSWLSVCLPSSDIAGCITPNVPADTVFTNHTGFEEANHILLNLCFCFISHPIGVKATNFSLPQACTIAEL